MIWFINSSKSQFSFGMICIRPPAMACEGLGAMALGYSPTLAGTGTRSIIRPKPFFKEISNVTEKWTLNPSPQQHSWLYYDIPDPNNKTTEKGRLDLAASHKQALRKLGTQTLLWHTVSRASPREHPPKSLMLISVLDLLGCIRIWQMTLLASHSSASASSASLSAMCKLLSHHSTASVFAYK